MQLTASSREGAGGFAGWENLVVCGVSRQGTGGTLGFLCSSNMYHHMRAAPSPLCAPHQCGNPGAATAWPAGRGAAAGQAAKP